MRRLIVLAVMLVTVFAGCGKDDQPTAMIVKPGSCCALDGTCTVTRQTACTGAWTAFEACDPHPCQPVGACCVSSSICEIVSVSQCLTRSGLYLGHNTACAPNSCSPLPAAGACCSPAATCVVTTQANCTGIWIEAVFCNPSPCPTTDGLVLIPAGTFAMGSPTDEPGREDFETQHQVTLTKPFYVCDHEVTQSEWETVMHWNDSHFRGADLPIATVTWFDAIDYCNRRSIGDSLAPAYTLSGIKRIGAHLIDATVVWDQGANGYRLPTEAEWEYACRAGSATAFCNGPITQVGRDCGDDPGLDLVGCYCGNASETTHAVGGKAANAWGLYDMHGNVWEWCWDWSGSYGGDAVDPSGPAAASNRVRRGGSSFSYAQYCRSAGRGNYSPGFGHFNLGFRLSRTAR